MIRTEIDAAVPSMREVARSPGGHALTEGEVLQRFLKLGPNDEIVLDSNVGERYTGHVDDKLLPWTAQRSV